MKKSLLAGALCLLVLCAPATAHAADPVPSLTPDATKQLWTQLTQQHLVAPAARAAAAGPCRPLRAVFYAQTDWLRLATTLAANVSPCAQYYISIPPVVADKTTFRTGQASQIRALGPNFHTLAEVNFTAWSNWVSATATTWYAAGVEARRRMAAAGYDVTQGDTWVLNEASSGVRRGDGSSRQNLEDFVHGLYDGDGTTPPAQGAVFINGIAQSTADLSTYKQNLQNWLGDTTFWSAMSAYVTDWSQELYGDVREYAVAGGTPQDRQTHLDAYLNHELALADAGPDSVATARTFLQSAYSPLANAAWSWTSAYGYTAVPYDGMEDYVSAQVDALRAADAGLAQDHFGFAWAPSNSTGLATADFNSQTGAILTRLAAAIHDSAQTTGAACAATGCAYVVDGAAFTEAWNTFSTWSPTAVGFTNAPAATTAGTPSTAPLTLQLAFGTLAQNAPADVPVNLTTSSPAGGFSTSPSGPWTPTLAVTIPAGSGSTSFYYEDTRAGTPTITAAAGAYGSAAQTETVTPGAVTSLVVAPTSATLAARSTQTFTATTTDAYGNVVNDPPAWTLSAPVGTLSASSGATTVLTAGTTAGSATLTATTPEGLTARIPVTVTVPTVSMRISSIAYSLDRKRLLVTVTAVDATGKPVAGAAVSVSTLRGTSSYLSGSGTTSTKGTFAFESPGTAPGGCYSSTIRSLTRTGFTWDGKTPSNKYCV